ncbi:MAG: 16S rRNA (cytidine(1402)-2'-O)-methyltransferase [Alphaproteobacteria bacterium]
MSRQASGARGTSGGDAGNPRNASKSSDVKPNDEAPRSKLPAGLYLVATPIGNAADITLRALDVLRRADVIACEDTRFTGKLLARHGISANLTPYHDHNADRARPAILARLAQGQAVALVSDAGSPLVSDPGFKLVRASVDAGYPVTAIPGASAAVVALQLSGLPIDRFLFAGFLPARQAARQKALSKLASVPASLVFFESPNRLGESVADMVETLGDRPAAIARELTKLYEEVRRGTLSELAAHYRDAGPPKGEIVIVVGGPRETAMSEEDLDARLLQALENLSLRDAAAVVASETGMPKREIYARALAVSRGRHK